MANDTAVKKPSVFQKLGRSWKDMIGELKKIVWPSKKQVINNTGVVIVAVIISSLCVSLIDYAFGLLVRLFFGS